MLTQGHVAMKVEELGPGDVTGYHTWPEHLLHGDRNTPRSQLSPSSSQAKQDQAHKGEGRGGPPEAYVERAEL